MHCPIVLVLLIFAILLQSLNASFKLSSTATGGFRELQDANINLRAVQDVPAVDAATRDLAASKPKRIIMVDNGGVLKSQNVPPQEEHDKIVKILTKLTQDDRNEVWVITARTLGSVTKSYGGIPGLHLAGEMGTHVDKSEVEYYNDLKHMRVQIPSIKDKLQAAIGKKSSIHLEDLTNTIVMQYDVSTPEKAKEKEQFLQNAQKILNKSPFQDYRLIDRPYAHKDFATISHKDCHKGTLVELLMKKHKATPGTLFLSIGDQSVDERMFSALRAMEATETKLTPNSNYYLPILVYDPENAINAAQKGPRMTAAHRKMKDSSEVLDFLDGL